MLVYQRIRRNTLHFFRYIEFEPYEILKQILISMDFVPAAIICF